MWRPITRTSLVLASGICLLTVSGCSMFRSEIADPLLAPQPRHFPSTGQSTSSAAPPQDPLATASLPAEALPAEALPAVATPVSSTQPLPLSDAASATSPAGTTAETTPTETKSDAAAASCFVEIRALGEEPRRIRMSLEDAGYVQAVLDQTGLVKEFRNMQIELSRKLPDGARHKLEIRYDRKRKHVVSAFDYALHPHDLLVIREDSMTSFDEMLKKLAGPLAR